MNTWVTWLSPKEKDLLRQILKTVSERRRFVNVFPPAQYIFRALERVDVTRVVILGQDPYPTLGNANGLAFAVNEDVELPASLRNILKELECDIGEYETDRTLTHWANQGVLLLNTTLTVEEKSPGSHQKIGWEKITNRIIKSLNDNFSHLVFILWGNHARSKSHIIDESKHCVIESAHPSPLSAHRGFFGSKPFSKTNQYLQSVGQSPIRW